MQAGTIEKTLRTISSDFLKRLKLPLSNRQAGEKKREKGENAVGLGVSLVGRGEHTPSYPDTIHGKGPGPLSASKRTVQHLNPAKSKVLMRKEVGGGTRSDLIDSLSAPIDAKASKQDISISNKNGPKKITTSTVQRKATTYQKKRSPAVLPGTTTRRLPQVGNPTKRTFLTSHKVVTTSPKKHLTTGLTSTSTTSSSIHSLPKHLEKSGNVYFIPQTFKSKGEPSETFKVPSKHGDSGPKIERPAPQDPPQAAHTLLDPLVSHSIPHGGGEAVAQEKGGVHNALPRSAPQIAETLENPPLAPGSRLSQVDLNANTHLMKLKTMF